MKTYVLLIFMNLFAGLASAQTNTFPPSGKVGIGTSTPAAKLSFNNVSDGSDGADGITWFNGAPLNYGIYRTSGSWGAPSYQQLRLQWDTGIIIDPGTLHGKSYVEIQGNGLRVMSGNIGIGIINPTEKLAVNGNIRAREIRVETTGWPDYVFSKTYELPSLQSTEQYLIAHGHLPGIPSAAEVAVNGIALGEMNVKLLEKIEQLTLHVIALKKEGDARNKKLMAEIANLKGNTLKSRLAGL
ncbi:MAG: hypothetical protein H7069_06810 [Phormidesmis sp. FL-bin-119]|nr:hypothetical protein [Pedobacter sp.]